MRLAAWPPKSWLLVPGGAACLSNRYLSTTQVLRGFFAVAAAGLSSHGMSAKGIELRERGPGMGQQFVQGITDI